MVGAGVELGEHCELMSHVVIHGPAKIGAHNRFFPFFAVGGEPQDLTFKGEETRLEIGNHNVFREYVTLNRGHPLRAADRQKIGSHTLLMAYAHVGHDSVIGDHAMLVNAATLAGHVTVEEWAVVGALSAVHQFTRVGATPMLAEAALLPKMFALCQVRHASRSENLRPEFSGAATAGFSEERIGKIHHAFRVLLNSRLNTAQAAGEAKVRR